MLSGPRSPVDAETRGLPTCKVRGKHERPSYSGAPTPLCPFEKDSSVHSKTRRRAVCFSTPYSRNTSCLALDWTLITPFFFFFSLANVAARLF